MNKSRLPVLDISFSAAKTRGIHGERYRLESSLFSSPHKLLNNLPVFVNLQSSDELWSFRGLINQMNYGHSELC
jgi:hypothetical protein